MYNPPHPGEFILQVYLDPDNLSGRELAGKLGVAGKDVEATFLQLPIRPFVAALEEWKF